jgi:hypothetical protein
VTDCASLGRSLILPLVSVMIYFVARPMLNSDAAALAITGAVPAIYTVVMAMWRRRLDFLAAMLTVGFAAGCVASLLAGGSSLPLKLHEAAVTFVLGVVLLVAGLIRRPVPIRRVLKITPADRSADLLLGGMIGGFLILHALLHLVLALTMSTTGYLVAGRITNIATLAVGVLLLSAYVRRQRRSAPDDAPEPSPLKGQIRADPRQARRPS